MQRNHVLNLSLNLFLSGAIILGLALTVWPTSAHGSNGNGASSGGGVPSAADDGSQSNGPIPPVVSYNQSDLNIINGFYLDLIDADLLALNQRGLSAEQVEALTNEIAEAQFFVNFVAQAQAQVQVYQEDEFCHLIRQKVEEISSRICDLNQAFREAHCDAWWYLPSICDMECLPQKNAAWAATMKRASAQYALQTCLGEHPDDPNVACADLVTALAAAIAAEKAADAALAKCLHDCKERLGDKNGPEPLCKAIWDSIQEAKNELKELCGAFELGPDGQPTDNPNLNATCPACKEVTSTGYEPIKCSAPQ